jgi:hypothetical protein
MNYLVLFCFLLSFQLVWSSNVSQKKYNTSLEGFIQGEINQLTPNQQYYLNKYYISPLPFTPKGLLDYFYKEFIQTTQGLHDDHMSKLSYPEIMEQKLNYEDLEALLQEHFTKFVKARVKELKNKYLSDTSKTGFFKSPGAFILVIIFAIYSLF